MKLCAKAEQNEAPICCECGGCHQPSAASAGYGADIIIIPADPRYSLDKKPLVTSEMKAECIGEFSFERECDGEDGETGYEKITVPWTTCKEIYKAMATAAARGSRVAP